MVILMPVYYHLQMNYIYKLLNKKKFDEAISGLEILSNKNNPVLNIAFENVYPVSLSGLNYTNDATDTEYMTAQATFQYQLFNFEKLT